MLTFIDKIVNILNQFDLTICTCESVTGGMVASNIVGVPNASKTFKGGLITYSNESKIKMVNVSKDTINKHGAVSKETVIEMVQGVKNKFKTDIAIAITGNAGPNPQENKPVGQAYIAIMVIDKINVYDLKSSSTTRNDIRIDLAYQTLNLLEKILDNMQRHVRN